MQSLSIAPPSKLIAVDFDPFADGELLLTAPATQSQTEIWLSVQMGDAANAAYNLSQSLQLTGALNQSALELALQQLVQRHESLRTTFSPNGETLCIAAALQIEIPTIDLSELTASARENQLAEISKQDVNQTFDIVRGPLFRAKIIKLADRSHLLMLHVHHIICDGWSWAILIEDLSSFYFAAHQGISPQLPAPVKFSDYAIAQAAEAHQQSLLTVIHGKPAETAQYWLDQFAASIPVVDFPTDRPRPPLRTYDSACEYWELSTELVSQLKQLGTKSGCSLVTTILAGFEVWLYRITGQTDLVVGLPFAGQPAVDQDRLVGHCVNLLPLHTKIDDRASFADYLNIRRSTILDAYDHHQFTFGSLMGKLALPRDLSRIPLVPIIFNLDPSVATDRISFIDLEVTCFSNPRDFGNFELFVNALELHGKINLECRYNTNLFDPQTIERRLAEFEVLLWGIVTNPAQSVGTLSLLTAPEQQSMIDWNATQSAYPDDLCLHQLVEQQAQLTPDAIAVIFAEQQLTYAELDARANQLAHYLIDLGVSTETFVGICIERSVTMVVGLLAVLKAGGAYVPIDPNYPLDRIEYMLEHAQIAVLLSQQALIAQIPTQIAQIVCLDTDWGKIAQTSTERPLVDITPANIAYVIYTSGSTGKPKGVEIQHRGVVNFLTSMQQQPGITATDILLSVTTLSFDIAVLEIFLPLTVGARVVLLSREDAMDGRKLAAEIDRLGITLMQATPATWQLLLAAGWQGNQQLKILSGGEPISTDLATQLLAKSAEVWNMYGPTETTIWSTIHQISHTERRIPIGKPIANTQIYILDSQLQPLPIGIPGELYIGGDGLARGYLHRPDLNLEKFSSHPAAGSGKLYQTGDLARYLPDGNIECLGRIDNQVKIRGFRIELGEIETVLLQHPMVQDVRVIDREDRPGDKRLVAYLVTHPTDNTSTAGRELRTFLQSRLPDYLIPTAFVIVAALPLTPNGKVDRRALPVPEFDRPDPADSFLAPSNELELQLTKIWEQVLGVQSIGIRDNFFELGGHSLIAVRLFAEIEQIWGRNLPLATLFQAQTIEKLASILQQEEWIAPWSSLVPIQPHGSKPPLFCIHPIGGNILEYYPLANCLGNEQPVYGLQSQGLDSKQKPLSRVEEMASHYIKDILTIQPHGPYLLLGYSFGGLIAFEIAQQLYAQGKKVEFLGLVDLNSPNLQTVRPSFAKSIQIHLHNLWHLSAKDRPKYIRDRIDYRVDYRGEKFDYREFVIKSLSDTINPSPQLLHLIDTNLQAHQNYIATTYPGDVNLFRCQVQTLNYALSTDLGWGDLVAGKLEIHAVPSIHYEILKEAGVQFVADKLKSCLAQIPAHLAEVSNSYE